jgi:hypothetical protein
MKKAFLCVIASASILLLGSSLAHATLVPAPEPSSLLLLGVGAAGLLVYRGMKNRKK